MTAITAVALPFMAVGQTTEEPQQTQSQTKQTETTAPAKGKKMHPVQDQSNSKTKAEAGTNAREQTNTTVKGRAHVNEHQPNSHATSSQTNVNTNTSHTTTINKDEFRTRHSEVFSLGRHPKDFFVQRYGANHFRMIGNSYFVFLDGCWVAVDVDGFTYTQRVICPGDPDFVEVVD
jgi:cytoskeletal protein RodZ